MFNSIYNRLDIPEHILMTVCYTFIPNLEAIIKNNRYSWNLGRIFKKYQQGAHFQV